VLDGTLREERSEMLANAVVVLMALLLQDLHFCDEAISLVSLGHK
jgi:hypothetical protein